MVGTVNDSLFFISWGDSGARDPTFMKAKVIRDFKKIFPNARHTHFATALVNGIRAKFS